MYVIPHHLEDDVDQHSADVECPYQRQTSPELFKRCWGLIVDPGASFFGHHSIPTPVKTRLRRCIGPVVVTEIHQLTEYCLVASLWITAHQANQLGLHLRGETPARKALNSSSVAIRALQHWHRSKPAHSKNPARGGDSELIAFL